MRQYNQHVTKALKSPLLNGVYDKRMVSVLASDAEVSCAGVVAQVKAAGIADETAWATVGI